MSATPVAVLEGVSISGSMNVTDEVVLAHVRANIRRGHPQVCPAPVKPDRICIVGGGPSLDATFDELRDLYFEGAKVVTVNGAYHWCLERNIRPSAQIVLDARPHNARFVQPDVPQCRYYLCSQCAPETFDAVEGRPLVGIWHDASSDAVTAELDRYYLTQWASVTGGTTVGTRAIGLMRMLGFLRMDLFGFDSCWRNDRHHSYAQVENDTDKRLALTVHPTSHPELARTFVVSPWHVKQLEDFVLLIRTSGEKFLLNVHGDGLLAYAMRAGGQVAWDAASAAVDRHTKE